MQARLVPHTLHQCFQLASPRQCVRSHANMQSAALLCGLVVTVLVLVPQYGGQVSNFCFNFFFL
jgi:hypothetical protein